MNRQDADREIRIRELCKRRLDGTDLEYYAPSGELAKEIIEILDKAREENSDEGDER